MYDSVRRYQSVGSAEELLPDRSEIMAGEVSVAETI